MNNIFLLKSSEFETSHWAESYDKETTEKGQKSQRCRKAHSF